MTETMLFTAGEVAGICGGSCKGNLEARIFSVVVDSRKSSRGALFVALAGERTDGHEFLDAALKAKAACILADLSRKETALQAVSKYPEACAVLVDDTLDALQALAREYRRRMKSLLRIGVTGSSGKTTTKECIAAALRGSFPANALAMNEGNLNSDIGLALSMFGLNEGHRVGVFEMGVNRKGEMDELARIYEPDIAVVTNIGTAHIGLIGSREGIADEKKRVFSLFDGKQCGFVFEDDPYRTRLSEGVRGRIETFGPRTTKGLESLSDRGLSGWDIVWKGTSFRFPLPGRHNLYNGLAALSVCAELDLDAFQVSQGLSSVRPLFGRSELFEGRVSLLRDCYNANPDSMEAALDFCDSLEWKGRKIYILGGMRELGSESEKAHRALGLRALRSKANVVLFFGDETSDSFQAATEASAGLSTPRLRHTDDMNELIAMTSEILADGDLVLMKASRGLELERLSDELFARGFLDAPSLLNPEAGHAS